MKNLYLFILLSLITQFFCTSQTIPDSIKQELERIVIKESNDKDLPAFSIVLVDKNEIILEAHQGSKTLDNPKNLVDINTIYRTGSVGKTITDLAILIAVEQKKLDLDEDIRLYIPEFEPFNSYDTHITLRHLIKHQSGLVREPPVGNYFDASSPSLEETVNSLNNTSLLWKPGTKTKYSNAGLAVVGRILEKVYKMDYSMVIHKLIFHPLGMKNSYVGIDSSFSMDLAKGYMWFPEKKPWIAPVFDLGMKSSGDLFTQALTLATPKGKSSCT